MSLMLSDKLVTVKKKHQCFGCLGVIPAGASAKKQSWIFDGDFCHGYLCGVCQIILADAVDLDEWYEGELVNEDWKSAAHKYEERTGTSYNSAIIPLSQLKMQSGATA
jgi:hypothetical protein